MITIAVWCCAVAVVAAGVAMASAAYAQRGPKSTVQELQARAAIQNLIAAYPIYVDQGKMPECILSKDVVILPPGGWRIEGRANAMRRFRGESFTHTTRDTNTPATSDRRPGLSDENPAVGRFVRHHMTSSMIEFQDAEHATGRTYWLGYHKTGPSSSGRYDDKYVKEDGRWVIKERKTRIEFFPGGPDSFGHKVMAEDEKAEAEGRPW
jgi:hypothetical protein